jgi:hypothetical protein
MGFGRGPSGLLEFAILVKISLTQLHKSYLHFLALAVELSSRGV